jgi:hypothetical protein
VCVTAAVLVCKKQKVLVIRGLETKAQKRKTATKIVSVVKSNSDNKKEIISAKKLFSDMIALIFKSTAAKDQ